MSPHHAAHRVHRRQPARAPVVPPPGVLVEATVAGSRPGRRSRAVELHLREPPLPCVLTAREHPTRRVPHHHLLAAHLAAQRVHYREERDVLVDERRTRIVVATALRGPCFAVRHPGEEQHRIEVAAARHFHRPLTRYAPIFDRRRNLRIAPRLDPAAAHVGGVAVGVAHAAHVDGLLGPRPPVSWPRESGEGQKEQPEVASSHGSRT